MGRFQEGTLPGSDSEAILDPCTFGLRIVYRGQNTFGRLRVDLKEYSHIIPV